MLLEAEGVFIVQGFNKGSACVPQMVLPTVHQMCVAPAPAVSLCCLPGVPSLLHTAAH